MKQTAVEWLESKLDDILELYPSEWDKVNEVIKQAKEMEKWQRMKFEIPELSDEEIDKVAKEYHRNNGVYYGQIKTFIDAIKWYKEQLKQRQ